MCVDKVFVVDDPETHNVTLDGMIASSRLEETFKIMKSSHPPTTINEPQHIIQCQIQTLLKHL